MLSFDNKHLDVHPLRKNKLNLESKLTEGKYKGWSFQMVCDTDPEYAKYFGDEICSDWSWPVLQYFNCTWEKYIKQQNKVKVKQIQATQKQRKEYAPRPVNWTFTFGKYQGYTVAQVYDADPGYISWCREVIGMNFELPYENKKATLKADQFSTTISWKKKKGKTKPDHH